MLRLILVLGMILVGVVYAFLHPFYALLFYVWNAYFRPEDWVWDGELIRSLRLSYSAAILALVSTLVRRDAVASPRHSHPLLGLMFLFAGQGLVSIAWSSHQAYAWPFWLEFFKVVVMTSLMVVLVDDLGKLRALLVVIALSLGLEGAKQGWAGLIRYPGARNDNPIAFLGDNNGVAVGMFMLVPVLAALARTTENMWARSGYLFVLLGVLYRGLVTYSRGGFLSSLALGAMYLLRSPRKFRVLGAMALAAAIVLPVLPDAFWDRMKTIVTFREAEDTSALGRLYFWQVALKMATARPLVGVGFNAYNVAYDSYDSTRGEYGTGRSVHSSWFGVLAELGYPGLILYVLILFLSLRNCQRVRRLSPEYGGHAHLVAYAAALESSLVVYFVGATFLPHQYNEMVWHCVGLSLVLLNVARRVAEETEPSAEDEAPAWSDGEPSSTPST
jgi:probable O-glycosylation ligase (exosortase A-associated)